MSKKKVIMPIVITVLSLFACFCAFMLIKTILEYRKAEDEYSDLNRFVSESTGDDELDADEVAAIQTYTQEQKYKYAVNYNRSDFPKLNVDFKGLKEVNPEVVAWVYVGAVGISYPVTQKVDDSKNEYYLHHTLEGTENSSGCIFMDYSADPQLKDWNTFFYGHNMKNGSMFGSLRKFVSNHKLFDKDPYIYVYREEGIYRFKIYSFYLDTPESKMYYICKTLKEYRAYIRTALEMSVYDCETPTSEEENSVTLVTCNGAGAGKKRFFLHGIAQDCYIYPPTR